MSLPKYSLSVGLAILLVFAHTASVQGKESKLWRRAEVAGLAAPPTSRRPQFVLEKSELKGILAHAPHERGSNIVARAEIELPLPDGTTSTFELTETEVMDPELAAKFPEIKTYIGRGLEDPEATAQIDWTPRGFHGQILKQGSAIYIDPAIPGETDLYVSYHKADATNAPQFSCLAGLPGDVPAPEFQLAGLGLQRTGRELRTYRLAMAAQGEFSQDNGGTVQSVMSEIVSIVNRINGMYQNDLCIRFQLVANNDRLIFLNPDTDPYSENAATVNVLLENQRTIDQIIGSSNYDIGHVLNTGQYGLAYISTVCVENWKARGCMGSSTPGDRAFWADFVAHEMGHQFGANHTFNSLDGHCNGNRSEANAYEPGSGSTIMAYAGLCAGDDLQDHVGVYFHASSIDAIMNFVTTGAGANVSNVTGTGNNPPNVDAGPNYSIPWGTPFKLTASGNDPDGDGLTYCWEELDLGPAQSVYDTDNGQSPLFRSFFPSTSPTRTFIRMSELLNNTRVRGEQLPMLPRNMKFRVTARDNRGGIAMSDTVVNVTGAGPFAITYPNWTEALSGIQTITWNVNGTTQSPINVSQVNILLSTNGGSTFNTVLAANTPNDGSQAVRLPNVNIASARLKIESVGNIFFDINDASFSIYPSTGIRPDLNRDGRTDLLWQSSAGSVAVWYMDGTHCTGTAQFRKGQPAPAGWRVVGFNDFDLNTHTDILFQHDDGRLMVWYMNGLNYVREVLLQNGQSAGSGWRVVGLGDFNRDGQTDIIFQHDSGQLAAWYMRGVNRIGNAGFQKKPAPGWRVVGLNDFDGDGHIDVLLQNNDGYITAWMMNGVALSRAVPVRDGKSAGRAWKIGGLCDFDMNGSVDLLFRNQQGALAVWYMDGLNFLGSSALRDGKPVEKSWTLVGPK